MHANGSSISWLVYSSLVRCGTRRCWLSLARESEGWGLDDRTAADLLLEYKMAIEKALAAAKLSIERGVPAAEVVKASIEALEVDVQTVLHSTKIRLQDDPIVNAGYGANLTEQGEVECDAR